MVAARDDSRVREAVATAIAAEQVVNRIIRAEFLGFAGGEAERRLLARGPAIPQH